MKLKAICVILGGGKSSRMGQDKANLRFFHKRREISLINYLNEKLKPLFNEIYFCAKNKPNDLECDFIYDSYPNYHPIYGIKSIQEYFKNRKNIKVFLIAVDFANINKTSIKRMYYKNTNCIAKTKKSHYLCGFYDLNTIKNSSFLNENNRIKDFFNFAKAKELYFKNQKVFININTPLDFKLFISF